MLRSPNTIPTQRQDLTRLLVESGRRPGTFVAKLQGTGEVIVSNSRQPVTDACRELLARGQDPAALITMRHLTKTYDSFTARPIGEWAEVTYLESDRDGLRKARWMPQLHEEGQKSSSEERLVPGGYPVAEIYWLIDESTDHNAAIDNEVKELRGQLDEARCLGPHDQTADVSGGRVA